MKIPKRIRYLIRRTYVKISNVIVFLSVVIERRWPVHKWPLAWRHCRAAHLAEVRHMLTELTMSGRVKRRIQDNEFVYYPMERNDEQR
jgi:hypothetical protein